MLFLCIFIAYVLPWLAAKFPPSVTVYNSYLTRIDVSVQQVLFKDLTSFTWRSAPDFSTLILTHRRGRQILIGVPIDTPVDAISAFLAERIPAQPSA